MLSPRIRYNIHDEGGVATYAEVEEALGSVGLELRGLKVDGDARPLRLPFFWVYGRKDSTVSVMGANIYPEDIEQSLCDEPELARVTNSFCLSLQEGEGGSVRPLLSFEISGAITADIKSEFEERIPQRLLALNADYREASREYREAVAPVVQLHPLGDRPFAGDRAKIKQARIFRPASES